MKQDMKFKDLGSTGISASVVGLGTFAIGGWFWGGTDEKDSIEAIHASIESGINLIDTAPVYGFGRSEQIVGKAIRGKRDRVLIATKTGLVWDSKEGEFFTHSDDKWATDGPSKYEVYRNLRPESIMKEVEASLRRLGTDYIDLYQTHWQDSTTPIEVTMEALTRLRDQGKIRAIGVSNVNVEQLEEYGEIASAQEKFNLIDRGIEEKGIVDYCVVHNIAILSYFTMEKGLLYGKMSPEREFKEGDSRKKDPNFSAGNIKKVNEMLNTFQPIAEKYGVSIAQLIIALTATQRGITHMLIGARNAKQAEENALGGSITLSDEDVQFMQEKINGYLKA